MNGTTTIRRSPIVLIRNFVAIEAAAFLLYFLSLGHGSYKSDIYNLFFVSNLIPYDVAKLVFFSAGQLAITIYAFLSWYYESYEVHPGMVFHSHGLFFKRRKSFPLEKSMLVTSSSGPLGKLLHYGTIRLESRHYSSIVLSAVSRPQNFLRVIEKAADPNLGEFAGKPDLGRLLSQEEHERLEFKSSLRFDHRLGQLNRDIEKSVFKTVAAFLNSRGGYLVIGVDDSRKPLGLEKDYETIQRKDSDGFENHFTQAFNSALGPEFRHLVKLWFHDLEGRDVCVIQVAPSRRPVYMKADGGEHFYVRTGNITTDLKFSEVDAYARSRWPRR